MKGLGDVYLGQTWSTSILRIQLNNLIPKKILKKGQKTKRWALDFEHVAEEEDRRDFIVPH
jgi:hypothetical protein